MVKNLPANAKDMSLIPGLGLSPGEEMATLSSILAWEISWTEEAGGLYTVHRVAEELDSTLATD